MSQEKRKHIAAAIRVAINDLNSILMLAAKDHIDVHITDSSMVKVVFDRKEQDRFNILSIHHTESL